MSDDTSTPPGNPANPILPVRAIAVNTFREVARDKVVYTFFLFAMIISF